MKARSVKKLDPEAPLEENAARIVKVRLDELRSFWNKAQKRKQVEAQHDMRIAAKRLRYVLEVTGFCFGRPAAIGRRRARDLQDILGEVHDCDVMLPRVLDHLDEIRASDASEVVELAGEAPDLDPRLAAQAPSRTAYRGLDVLAVYLRGRRQLLFARFTSFWERTEEDGVWLRLERAVDAKISEANERRRLEKEAEEREAEEREAEERERQAEAGAAAAVEAESASADQGGSGGQ